MLRKLVEAVPSTRTAPVVQPEEQYWRQELQNLDRYFVGLFTPEEAQQHADEELRKHDEIVNSIESHITKLKAFDLGFAGASEQSNIQKKVEDLESTLADAKRQRQRSINLCGASIRTSKELEPKRARWLELRQRERDLENASSLIKSRW